MLAGCQRGEPPALPEVVHPIAEERVITSREYDSLTLDNGLEVLLVSDPAAQTSSAALSVGVGMLQDPEYIEKEMNAIHAEWSMRRAADFDGMFELDRAMVSALPLAEMRIMTRTYFSAIENKNISIPAVDASLDLACIVGSEMRGTPAAIFKERGGASRTVRTSASAC